MSKRNDDAGTLPPFADIEALLRDPHGEMARLRAETPMIRIQERRVMVLRARDVQALIADPRIMQIDGADYVAVNGVSEGRAAAFLRDFFLLANGEGHRAGRAPFAKTFAHAAIKARRPAIAAVADRIVAEAPRGAPFDFVSRVAARVPAEMIAATLGLDLDDAPTFAALVYRLGKVLSPTGPREDPEGIEAAAVDLFAFVAEALAARRRAPREDLLTELVAGTEPEAMETLAHQLMGVLIGGSDTTRAGFAMIVALLLQHPEQWAAAKADPALIPGAVAEGLRFEPPVGSAPRFAAEPITIDGVTAPAGVMVAPSTLSAMRDPALYADPDRFDIRRTDHPRLHLVFGGGAHRCIGEMLARLEMEEALRAVIAQAPDLELIEAPRLRGFGGIREISPMIARIP